MNPNELKVSLLSEHGDHDVDLKLSLGPLDNKEMTYNIPTLQATFNVNFNIKYFDGNNLNDIIYDINYKMYKLNMFNGRFAEIYPLIDEQVTKQEVVLGSLMCERSDNILLITSYCRKCIHEFPSDVLAVVARYYLSTNRIDIFGTVLSENIAPNDTLILYKDYSYPFVRYDNIKQDEEFIILVQIMQVLTEEYPTINLWGLLYEKDRLDVWKDKTMDALILNVNDTVNEVVGKIRNNIPRAAQQYRYDVLQTEVAIIFNGMNVGGMKSTDFDRKIIDFGLKHGSIIQCYPFTRMGS